MGSGTRQGGRLSETGSLLAAGRRPFARRLNWEAMMALRNRNCQRVSGVGQKGGGATKKICFNILLTLPLLTGCGGPPGWVDQAWALKCGMSVEDVQILYGKEVKVLDKSQDWRTHFIGDNEAMVWFGFENGTLREYQSTWPIRGRIAEYQHYDLCEQTNVYD